MYMCVCIYTFLLLFSYAQHIQKKLRPQWFYSRSVTGLAPDSMHLK